MSVLFLALLAACSGGQQTTGSNSSGGEASGDDTGGAAGAQVQQQTPVNATIDPQNSFIPLEPPPYARNAADAAPEPAPEQAAEPSPAPSPAALSALPDRFRGRWGLVPNDCTPGRDDAKGLMTVSADRLAFYEARARPRTIRQESPDRLRLRLDYRGEGQSWTHDAVVTLADGGRTLIRDEPESDTGTLRYSRCPRTT